MGYFMLLTLTLRVRVKQMKWRWGVCLIALIPGQGELWIIECVGVQKVGTLLHKWFDSIRSWVSIHNASTCYVSKGMTHWIVGDGLHISFIYQLPHKRTFPAWHKDKQSQAWPLKEDFRQVPDHITGQVFQTTWRREVIPKWLSNQAKASSKWT